MILSRRGGSRSIYVRLQPFPAFRSTGVVNPHPSADRSRALQPTFFKQIRPSALAACQFPPVMTDATGEIHKPERW
jgi:hypothetical protein